MKGLTDIPGIRVGHVSDFQAITGCTAILCEAGAVGGVDLRGSASGTEEIATLDPLHITPQIHGILLAILRAGWGLHRRDGRPNLYDGCLAMGSHRRTVGLEGEAPAP